MNLHPVFVHFPIALLTIYALMELIRFKKLMNQPYWFYLKAVFLMVGGLGALVALQTGDMARAAVRQGYFTTAVSNYRQVLGMHKNFADASVIIFGILSVCYLILWLNRDLFSPLFSKDPSRPVRAEAEGVRGSYFKKFWQSLTKIAHAFVETKFVILLALAGLICITMTGGLGGIMVYGPAADPFFGFVYHLLFPGM